MSRQAAVKCDRCGAIETVAHEYTEDTSSLPKGWRRLLWTRPDVSFGNGEYDLCTACVEHVMQALLPVKS